MIVLLDKETILESTKSLKRRVYRDRNKEKIAAKDRLYRENNKEKRAETNKNWQNKNKNKIQQYQKEYRIANKEKKSKYRSEYYKENKEKLDNYNKEYRKKNKKKFLNVAYLRREKRIQEDECFKLAINLRRRLYMAIKKGFKTGSAVRDLGCSIPELKHHIETHFDSGMTWNNWGKVWHLDHIYPLAAANLEDRTEFLAVNNWRNLQPLAVKENLEKHDTITPGAQKLFEKLCKEFS